MLLILLTGFSMTCSTHRLQHDFSTHRLQHDVHGRACVQSMHCVLCYSCRVIQAWGLGDGAAGDEGESCLSY